MGGAPNETMSVAPLHDAQHAAMASAPTVEQMMEAAAATVATSAGPVGAAGPAGRADVEIMALSSGTSDASLQSPFASPPTAAPPQRRRRAASEMSSKGDAPTNSAAHSRQPSPAGSARSGDAPAFKRHQHRRIEPAGDSYPGRLQALEDQHEADREAIAWLTDQANQAYEKCVALERTVSKLQRAEESTRRGAIESETAIVKRLDETKIFLEKKLDQEIQKMMKQVEHEIVDPKLMTGHLRGHSAPILEPLVHEFTKAKVNEIEEKLGEMSQWVHEKQQRDVQVEQYLNNLHGARPEEGRTVTQAFMNVAQELIEIRAAATSGDARGASPAGATPPGIGDTGIVKQQMADMQAQIVQIRHNILQDRCHCVHVDSHEHRINDANRRMNIVETAIQGIYTSMASSSSSLPAVHSSAHARPVHAQAPGAGGDDQCGCGGCHGDHATAPRPPVGPPRPNRRSGRGGPGGDGGDGHTPLNLSAAFAGYGNCHCIHLDELVVTVEDLAWRVDEIGANQEIFESGDSTVGAHFGMGRARRARPQALPLELGPMGQLTASDSRLFDNKLTNQPLFCFDGQKGGVNWKGKIERYFISKCPALMEMLKWAEKYDGEKIGRDLLLRAVASTEMTEELLDNVNCSIRGFISNCVTSEAETIFKTAEKLQGFDAWRRIVRYIDHGKEIKLEGMRTEMKTLHLKPIKNLESVPIGIAEYDLKMKEYNEAGGTLPSENEMKNDLLNILPESLRDNLLWRATDPGPYTRFRDMILAQAARTLLTRKRLPVHNVENSLMDQLRGVITEQEDSDDDDVPTSLEELVAAIRTGKFQPRQRRSIRDQPSRPPRKCANCGKEHKELKCPHPEVAKADRVCWTCGEKYHQSRDCPNKKIGNRKVNAIEDRPAERGIRRIAAVGYADDEGFQKPRRTVKPQHVTPTVGSFIGKNSFEPLKSQKQRKADRRAAMKLVEDYTPEVEELITIIEDSVDSAEEDTQGMPPLVVDSDDEDGKPQRAYSPPAAPLPTCYSRVLDDESDDEEEDTMEAFMDELGKRYRSTPEALAAEAAKAAYYERLKKDKEAAGSSQDVAVIDYAEEAAIFNTVPDEVRIRCAADSGAVDNVIGPEDLPRGATPAGNPEGKHFVGASGEHIERHGPCDTIIEGKHGKAACEWQVADVTRPLQSISRITGPEDGPGQHEVLFTNKAGYVIPAGHVEQILKKTKPIVEYERSGGLYLADLTLSSFTRRGRKE